MTFDINTLQTEEIEQLVMALVTYYNFSMKQLETADIPDPDARKQYLEHLDEIDRIVLKFKQHRE